MIAISLVGVLALTCSRRACPLPCRDLCRRHWDWIPQTTPIAATPSPLLGINFAVVFGPSPTSSTKPRNLRGGGPAPGHRCMLPNTATRRVLFDDTVASA